MGNFLIFAAVMGVTYWALTRTFAAPPKPEEKSPPVPARRAVPRLDPERFAAVMELPPTAKSLSQIAQLKAKRASDFELDPYSDDRADNGRSEQRNWKTSIEEFRADLIAASFAVECPFELVIIYKGEAPERRIAVQEMLMGEHAFYLETWCYLRRDRRMFRVDEIDQVVTADGEVFPTGNAWLSSLPALPAEGDG